MVFTSYYANIENIDESRELFSISRTTPDGISISSDMRLAPTKQILTLLKERRITVDQYVDMYVQDVLSLFNPQKIAKEHKGKVLLCYESPDDFCHRKIVRKWLARSGKLSLEYKSSYTIAVVGSRGYENEEEFLGIMNKLVSSFDASQRLSFVSGGARGADTLAENYAKEKDIDIDVIEADWDTYGKRAGFVRNKKIWEKADFGIAFWDGQSVGTRHSFDLAKALGKTLVVYDYIQKKFYVKNFENYVASSAQKRKKRFCSPSLF